MGWLATTGPFVHELSLERSAQQSDTWLASTLHGSRRMLPHSRSRAVSSCPGHSLSSNPIQRRVKPMPQLHARRSNRTQLPYIMAEKIAGRHLVPTARRFPSGRIARGHHHHCPIRGELARDGPANPRTAASDEDDLVFEIKSWRVMFPQSMSKTLATAPGAAINRSNQSSPSASDTSITHGSSRISPCASRCSASAKFAGV